jgi:AGCS family alanine or glycine:cation symporter
MWITAIFGMTTKFVEVTMGHKYRTKLEDGSISGGPMYYIEHALNMKWAGILFAFLMMITAIGSGNMPQINNIALVMNTEFSVPKLFTGLFLGVLLWIIIIGGIKRIASVASKIIPIMGLIYFGGALVILVENYQNIIPSFNAIFAQVFTGSAAVGGFLGASFAMSLKYGVARGLYSNEAGQGSSPIVVCSVTALVILSSGVWTEKFDTTFSKTDMVILDGTYSDTQNVDGTYLYPNDMNELTRYVQSIDSDVSEFSGVLEIQEGQLMSSDITVLHSRSIAENILVKDNVEKILYTGSVTVIDGKVKEPVIFEGKSLVSSAELTAKAFSQGVFGQYGGKLVAIALLLFAFSTAITWCYYGDRSTAYIFGERGVFWYRNFYVLCFILAAVIDTTIVWNIAYVVVALVSIPNLIALFVLRNEMKDLTKEFIIKN